MASLLTSMHQKRWESMFELGSRMMLPTLPPKSSTSLLLQSGSPNCMEK